MATFSERMKEQRRKHGLTQAEVGEIIGTRQDSISTYERGLNYPEVRNLIILADYFGVSTDYLLGRTDNPEINR